MPMPPAFTMTVLTTVAALFLLQRRGCAAFAPPHLSRASLGRARTRTALTRVRAAGTDGSTGDRGRAPRVTALSPLKAAMLTQSWQALLVEVDQKVGIVPELGRTSVGVQRFGPELARRTACKRQFEFFHASAFGLARADKSGADAAARRATVPGLAGRGAGAKVFACLTAPATMSLVECDDDDDDDAEHYWSVLSLIVNPTERSLPVVVACERAALDELRALAGTARLRLDARVMSSLAGSAADLGLVENEGDAPWLLSVTAASSLGGGGAQ